MDEKCSYGCCISVKSLYLYREAVLYLRGERCRQCGCLRSKEDAEMKGVEEDHLNLRGVELVCALLQKDFKTRFTA